MYHIMLIVNLWILRKNQFVLNLFRLIRSYIKNVIVLRFRREVWGLGVVVGLVRYQLLVMLRYRYLNTTK